MPRQVVSRQSLYSLLIPLSALISRKTPVTRLPMHHSVALASLRFDRLACSTTPMKTRYREKIEELSGLPGQLKREEKAHAEVSRCSIARSKVGFAQWSAAAVGLRTLQVVARTLFSAEHHPAEKILQLLAALRLCPSRFSCPRPTDVVPGTYRHVDYVTCLGLCVLFQGPSMSSLRFACSRCLVAPPG